MKLKKFFWDFFLKINIPNQRNPKKKLFVVSFKVNQRSCIFPQFVQDFFSFRKDLQQKFYKIQNFISTACKTKISSTLQPKNAVTKIELKKLRFCKNTKKILKAIKKFRYLFYYIHENLSAILFAEI